MSTKKINLKIIEFDRSANHWKVTGFSAGERIKEVVLTDEQELFLMQSFAESAQDFLWNHDEKKGEKAVECFNKAINFAPASRKMRKGKKYKDTLASIYRDRAQAFMQANNFELAIGDADMAVKLEPNDDYAHDIRARVYLGAGNEGEACLSYIKSKEIQGSERHHDRMYSLDPFWVRLWRGIRDVFRTGTVKN